MVKSGNTSRKAGKLTKVSMASMPESLPLFHKKLAAWYKKHGRRHLPWRNTKDPYAIWVSEVMLQQTQVKTVLERFYTPFLQQFPSILTLADASPDAVMKAWEGLGYYTRARNLQKATQALVMRQPKASISAPLLPNTCDDLLSLPGIGRNTAHAILAFAFQQPVAVMEANVKRVLCRIFALQNPDNAQLWSLAHRLLNTKAPFDYNQAMMDLGAMICTKSNPQCQICPAAILCRGKDNPLAFPLPKAKKTTPVRKRILLALYDSHHRFVVQARSGEFLSGLYGFIELEAQPSQHKHWHYLGHISQSYSHFTLEAQLYAAAASKSQARQYHNHFYSLDDIAKLPLSRADSKMLAMLKHYASTRDFNARRKTI